MATRLICSHTESCGYACSHKYEHTEYLDGSCKKGCIMHDVSTCEPVVLTLLYDDIEEEDE
jgi:hypothetical protein